MYFTGGAAEYTEPGRYATLGPAEASRTDSDGVLPEETVGRQSVSRGQ